MSEKWKIVVVVAVGLALTHWYAYALGRSRGVGQTIRAAREAYAETKAELPDRVWWAMYGCFEGRCK